MAAAEGDPRKAARELDKRLTQCQVHQLLECQRRVRKARAANGAASSVAAEQELLHKLRPSGGGGSSSTGSGSASGSGGGGPTAAIQGKMRSRLMSKKQLQDMAVGVKELSKRLGSVRQKLNVTTVFLLTKKYDESLIAKTRELVEWLLSPEQDRPYRVCVLCGFLGGRPVACGAGKLMRRQLRRGHTGAQQGVRRPGPAREGADVGGAAEVLEQRHVPQQPGNL